MKNNAYSGAIKWILPAAGVLVGSYLLGMFFPEPFWATHAWSLLPPVLRYGLLIGALGLIAGPFWWKTDSLETEKPFFARPTRKYLTLGLMGIGVGGLCLAFPIALDFYGDAFFVKQAVEITIPNWDARLLTELLKPNLLDTKSGLVTFYELNNFFTWLFGVQGEQVTPVMEAVLGALFAFIWLSFIDRQLKQRGWKLVWAGVGLTAPFMAAFMGHYETYFLSYTAILIWFSALERYFKSQKMGWLIALPFLFLLAVQCHITNWLLFPGLVFVYAYHFREKASLLKRALTPAGVSILILLPALVVGLIAYVFIWGNHDGPRQFSTEDFEDTLFLPLWTAEPPPLDRYNLFSGAHILDYFNLMLFWSGGLALLLVPPLTFLRKRVPWNNPLLLISMTTFVLYFGVFFVLNPLLGASQDWDLFIAPGLVLLPTLVFVYTHLEKELSLRTIAGPVLGICLLGLSFLMVNAMPEPLSQRYELIGRRNFKTYWIGTSSVLISSIQMTGTPSTAQEKLLTIIDELKPYAVQGNDKEYANLLYEAGIYHRNNQPDNAQALKFFEMAYPYAPQLGINLYQLTVTHFEEDHFQEAYFYGDQLAKLRYPPYKKTLKIAIHVSLAAKEYQSAANYAVTYLNRWQDDPVIEEVEFRLRTGDRIEDLGNLFGN